MPGRSLSLSLALFLSLALCEPAQASPETLQTFDACWEIVPKRFYDKKLHGVDWNAIKAKYRPQAAKARPGPELHAVLNAMLRELKASHVSILHKSVYDSMRAELRNQRPRARTFGILLEETLKGRLFVRAMYEGGPGPRGGLRYGDRIVKIGGEPALGSKHLVDAGYDPGGPRLFFFRPKEERLELVVQRTADAASRETLTIEAQRMNGVDAARNSVRIVKRGGLRIGTIHVWFCQRGMAEAMEEAFVERFHDCDALVVDLRGRGGFANIANRIVNFFRTSERRLFGKIVGTIPPRWRKPVVFVIDDKTRSAKELIAFRIKRNGIGPLVGTRTEGAVLAAGFFPLPDGSYVELPISDVRVDGVRLEGVGVLPDHEVDSVVPYAGGRDTAFEKALAVAVVEVRKARLRAREFIRLDSRRIPLNWPAWPPIREVLCGRFGLRARATNSGGRPIRFVSRWSASNPACTGTGP